jgi:nucleosome binding factor SPN SPT16 subunit
MDQIPNEMLLEIIQYIDPIDILKYCCLVNHNWNLIIKSISNDYWKYHIVEEFKKTC